MNHLFNIHKYNMVIYYVKFMHVCAMIMICLTMTIIQTNAVIFHSLILVVRIENQILSNYRGFKYL